MKKFFLLISFSVFIVQLNAQNHDNIWLVGTGETIDTLGYSLGNTSFDFSDVNNPEIKRVPEIETYFLFTTSTMSDSSGQLQFYSNGQRIENAMHEIIENGDSISNNLQLYEHGYAAFQSMFCLPHPSRKDSYGLFQSVFEGIDTDPSYVYAAVTSLYYNEIDMQANNGAGEVVIRKQLLLADTFEVDKLTAVKHANGGDWWILIRKLQSNVVYRILYGTEGVTSIDTQHVVLTAPLLTNKGQAVFSPDGTKYVTLNFAGEAINDDVWVYFYDFDRCTGLLSNQKEWYYSDFCWAGGAAISPNSRFAYVSTSERIYQFDLWEDEPTSTYIEYRDGFGEPYPLTFGTLQLAPDGKIYGGAGISTNQFMDVIHQPNKKGEVCQIEQHGIKLPALYNNGIPTFPNYRLGPLDGSPCDTLGLNNMPIAKYRYEQDTLDYLQVEFTDLSYYEPVEWHWDFGDNTTSQDTSPVHVFPQSGTYEVCLTVSNVNGENTFCRTLSLGTVSSSGEAEMVNVNVFPNPCREGVNVILSDYLPRDAKVVLYDAVGQSHKAQVLQTGWNILRLDGLQKGLYFYEIWEGDVLLDSGKLVKVE